MNKKALLSHIGSPMRIRPIARRVFEAQHLELEQFDDLWYLRSPTRSDAVIALWNARIPHVVELGADNVQEFRSPDFLLLKAQIILRSEHCISNRCRTGDHNSGATADRTWAILWARRTRQGDFSRTP
jgi:hypothetical protein